MVRDLGCRFVLVDPIVASIDLGLDAHKDQHVRSVLRKLVAKFDGDEVRLLDGGAAAMSLTSDVRHRGVRHEPRR